MLDGTATTFSARHAGCYAITGLSVRHTGGSVKNG